MASTAYLDGISRPQPVKAELRGEISAQQPAWLTDAVAGSVHAERGTVKRIAAALGVTEARVYEVADRYTPRALRASWIPAIVRECGLDVLQAIALQCSAVVVPMPAAVAPTVGADVLVNAADVMRETADVLTSVSASVTDGRLSDAERLHITKQIAEAHVALATLAVLVSQQAAA